MSYELDKDSLKSSLNRHKIFMHNIFKSNSKSVDELLSDASKSELVLLCKIIHCIASHKIPILRGHFAKFPVPVKRLLRDNFKVLALKTIESKSQCLALLLNLKLYLPSLLHFVFP